MEYIQSSALKSESKELRKWKIEGTSFIILKEDRTKTIQIAVTPETIFTRPIVTN